MRCSNCFHYDICGEGTMYNDASMCKQYIPRGRVLCGPALEVVEKELERLQARNARLETELGFRDAAYHDLEKEVELLRIIKQTLEMQSGMKFDI